MAKSALNRGTLEELRARTSSRREAARERDDQRFRLAGELADGARVSIAEEKGYLVLPPGSIAEAQPVIEAGNQVVDSIGHDRLLTEFNSRHDTMSRGFLPEHAFELGSPYMNFALHEDIVAVAAAYLGVVPILLVPTFNGRPVRANSSDPVAQYGVLKSRAEAWRDVLEPDAIARVEDLAGDLYSEAAG